MMRKPWTYLVLSGAACAATSAGVVQAAADGLAITTYANAQPVTTLANALLAANSGITVLSSSFIGADNQSATYTGFDLASSKAGQPTIAVPNGVLLTDGSAQLPLTNTSTAFSHTTGTGSNAELTAISGVPTYDQNVLTLSFTVNNPTQNAVIAKFVYGSDEYPEYPSYTDAFGFFVDGKNYAVFPDGKIVTVSGSTAGFFNDNTGGSYGLEYDGISNALTIDALLDTSLKVHTLTIAVADAFDQAVDSGAFVGGLQSGTATGGGGIVPNAVIDTTHGDIQPNVFSLGSDAAKSDPVEFAGGTLRMVGGAFPDDIIPVPVTIDESSGTVDTSTGNGGFSGVVSGPGSLTIIGGGTFNLTGANTYQGGTILSAGTLAIGNATALGAGTLTMADGTTLGFTAGGLTVANDIVLGTTVVTGDPTIDTGAFAETISGTISGNGALTKLGSGTLTLTAANTYSGGTALTGGTLAVGNSTALGAGTLTFAGGMLQAAAEGLTLTNAAVLSKDGVIDTNGHGLTYAGAISGGGGLGVIGGGTLTLTQANAYAGGTSIVAAGVILGADNALSTGALSIVGPGYVDLAGHDQTVTTLNGTGRIVNTPVTGKGPVLDTLTVRSGSFSGAIADGGAGAGAPLGRIAVDKVSGGTLALLGADSYSGGTIVHAGTLVVGNGAALGTGALTLDDGTTLGFAADAITLANDVVLPGVDPTIDTGSANETMSGAIAGPGGLTKIGSGALDLTGTSPYTGATDVVGGTLFVDGSINGSVVTVGNGAGLGGGGSVGALIVQSGATVAPSAGKSLTVVGTASFLAGSTYQVTVNGDGTNSKLVTDKASLGGGTLSILAGTGTYKASTYTLLTATDGVTGTFGTVTTASTFALLDPTVSYGADDVVLTLHPVAFATLAQTPNQAATAAAIQALGPSSSLYQAALQLTAAQAPGAFASASGVTNASVSTVVATTSRLMTGLLIDRLWDLNGNGLSARQVLDQFAPDGSMPALVQCYGPVADPVPAAPQRAYTAWGEGFGTFGRTDGGANAGSLGRSQGGFILGIDTPVDHVLGSSWRVGAAGGYTNTTFTSSLDGGSGTVQGVFGSLYGGARYGAIDVRVGATAGGNFTDAQRNVMFPGLFETEKSSSNGYTVQGFGEVGYRFANARSVIEPVVGASILHIHTDAFAERGGAAALDVAGFDDDLGTTSLGVRGELSPFRAVPLMVHGYLAWQHVVGNVAPASVVAFEAAPASTFSISGAPLDRDALAAEFALDYRATAAVDIGLSYNGLVGATAQDHSIKGRMEYRF